jgi:hypothetical protein
MMKKTIKITVKSFIFLIILFLGIVTRLVLVRSFDVNRQEKHMEDLRTLYASNTYETIDEQTFINFNMDDDTIRLDDIQMIASHNSYKKKGPAIGRFFVGLGDSFEEARALKYGYQSITDQLNLGIRSFEFDLRYRNGVFELTHVPLVDNSSQAVNFELLLEEIRLYSEHQTHLPIIILIEVKDDWMMLDPYLEAFDDTVLENLDTLIKDELTSYLFKPSDMVSPSEVLRDVIIDDGWPLINDLLNKTIFIMHPGNYTESYYQLDQNLQTQSMFIGSNYQESLPSYASFFVQNGVDLEIISSLVDQHFMVRTRIDENLEFSQTRFDDAVLSGAQILTTDFSVGRNDLDSEDVIYLENDKMIIKKE